MSGCVFFICTAGAGLAGGSGISAIRAVSFFGPGAVKSGAALTVGGALGSGSSVGISVGGAGEKIGGGGSDCAAGVWGGTGG